jgi:hypothetical protein
VTVPDPLAEAEVLLAYGRKAQALGILRDAALADPDRMDIKRKLAVLSTTGSDIQRPTLIALPHLILAWVLYLSSLLLMLGLVGLLGLTLGPIVQHLFPGDPRAELSLWGILIVLAGAGAAIFAGTYAALVLFLRAWFAYLNLLSEATRELVDARLPTAMAVRRMEPLYSKIRQKVLRLSDGS